VSPRLVPVTETPTTPGDRWATICALIAKGRAFEAKACEAKSEEGEMLMLDEANACFDQAIGFLSEADADPMIDILTDAILAHERAGS
jgi:hypothetical protein